MIAFFLFFVVLWVVLVWYTTWRNKQIDKEDDAYAKKYGYKK